MGIRDWFKRKPGPRAPEDPLAAYDGRVDALAERAALLRKSAATLLAVRRDLDRRLANLDAQEKGLRERLQEARALDTEAAEVLGRDLERLERDRAPLAEQRERVAHDAAELAEAVRRVETESEELARERDGARARLAASGAVAVAHTALEDRVDELLRLDAARDEVERAHALAEIYRDDARLQRSRTRER